MHALPSPLRHISNVLLDIRYGGWLGGLGVAPSSHRARGCYSTVNSDYCVLAQMFTGRLRHDDVLVDVGSGRGRVINYWLWAGHRGQIYGLEIERDHAIRSARRLARWGNVTILNGDAIANLPANATLLFLFNPFDRRSMCRLRDAIPRRVRALDALRILYYAPTCIDAWSEDDRWKVQLRELELPGGSRVADRHRRYALITPAGALLRRRAACG